ncbi:MAG: biotin/lipoyl-containing protein, partial [Myxococcota bacterium]
MPSLGESVKTATIARWLKKPGDYVKADEAVVELDSDKASMEVPAPAAGQLGGVLAKEGDEVTVGQVIAQIAPGAAPAAAPPAAPAVTVTAAAGAAATPAAT